METFKEWINKAISSGNLCETYTDKVRNAGSRKALMDIVLDANGVSYLVEMQEKGRGLPYEVINNEFRSYINGRYVGEFRNAKGNGYTSKLYCCYTENSEIIADTTALVLLGCTSTVTVPENSIVEMYIDSNCDIEISCPMSSQCYILCSPKASIGVRGNKKNLFIKNIYG